jgi:hypothetical protein
MTIIFLIIAIICITTTILTEERYAIRVSLLLILMAGGNHLLWKDYKKWLPDEKYRLVAEGIFLLPILVL